MKVQIEIKANFAAPFMVGSGALGDVLSDKPTIRDGQQRPIIPASAFKGRLRQRYEQLLRALLDDDGAACHAPAPQSTCPLDPAWLGNYCPVCRVFGSPQRPSSLMFSDLRWQEDLAAPSVIRSGVSIRRSRRVAEPARLYDLEAVDPVQIQYLSQITGFLVEDDAQALLALLLVSIQDIQTLGGGRGSGLGRCHLETRMRVNGKRVNEAWLRQGLAEGVAQWKR